jgi:transposase
MVVPPSADEEDRRRTCRDRAILLRERIRHVNRVKVLLSDQGIVDYEPLERDRPARLDELRTGDGRPLPPRLKAELLREIELIELLLRQITDVEAERDAAAGSDTADQPSPSATLMRLKAIGPQIATTVYVEGLFRDFANRREVAAYAGLVPTPWAVGPSPGSRGSRRPAIAGCARP